MSKKKPKKKQLTTTEQFENALKKKDNVQYSLRLFVTGITPKSLEAIEHVRSLCEKHLKGRYTLEIIDIYKEPSKASKNQIIATPTLLKKLPLPIKKFVGNMERYDKILAGLDIKIMKKSNDSEEK